MESPTTNQLFPTCTSIAMMVLTLTPLLSTQTVSGQWFRSSPLSGREIIRILGNRESLKEILGNPPHIFLFSEAARQSTPILHMRKLRPRERQWVYQAQAMLHSSLISFSGFLLSTCNLYLATLQRTNVTHSVSCLFW